MWLPFRDPRPAKEPWRASTSASDLENRSGGQHGARPQGMPPAAAGHPQALPGVFQPPVRFPTAARSHLPVGSPAFLHSPPSSVTPSKTAVASLSDLRPSVVCGPPVRTAALEHPHCPTHTLAMCQASHSRARFCALLESPALIQFFLLFFLLILI